MEKQSMELLEIMVKSEVINKHFQEHNAEFDSIVAKKQLTREDNIRLGCIVEILAFLTNEMKDLNAQLDKLNKSI